jgi:SAM-dependent methyltransferase
MPLPPLLFDRRHHSRLVARSRPHFARHAFLYDEACRRLAERCGEINRTFDRAVTLDDRAGSLAAALAAVPSVAACYASDSVPPETGFCADPEALPLAEGQQPLIASVFSLQSLNDVPGHLVQVRRALRPDGVFLATFLGGETLHELRACLSDAELAISGGCSSRFAPLIDVRAAGALLQRAGFTLPVVDRDTITVTYGSLTGLLHDLRGMALTNSLIERPRRIPPRGLFALAEALYRERFATPEGRLAATFELIHLMGWAPHASQQQPARRGSATTALEDVVGKRNADA